MKNLATEYRPSFFDRPVFAVVVSTTLFLTLLLILYFIDFVPGLTGLNVRIYSGMQGGGYSATAEKLAAIAAKRNGKITNFPTQGSLENLKLLAESSENNAFALAQNGLPIQEGLELVTRLSKSETVFFLGRNAGAIKTLAGLRDKHIGIGPEGGWIEREVDTFAARGFTIVSLGDAILRTEAAVAGALAQLALLRRL